MAISLPSLASPKSQLWLLKGDLEKQWRTLEKRIKDHPFNHAVEVFLPQLHSLPGCVSCLSPPHYYHSQHLPISHFLLPALLSRYFSYGGPTLSPLSLSTGRRIDAHNVFAILPSGTLLLSLDKDTYEELGLQGKRSRYQKHRYVVEVELNAECFKPGRPCYERAKTCLQQKGDLQADFILTWDNSDSTSQSQFMDDFKATKHYCSLEQQVITNSALPVIRGDSPHGLHDDAGKAVCCSAQDVHTWLGGVACGLDIYEGGSPGNYVTTFQPPDPTQECDYGVRSRWTGMVCAGYIWTLVSALRQCLEADGSLPWAALTVWGFEDAPVSWRTNEHGWHRSGDNHYTLVMFRTGQFWQLTSLASHDVL